MRNLFLAACLLLRALPAGAEVSRQEFQFEGLDRSYLTYVPDRLGSCRVARPLVLVLHGGGGSGREVRWTTGGRFDELADRHGFIVVYPDAVSRLWDTGTGLISSRLSPRRDDIGFLERVIDRVAANYPVDRRRVFVTGMSRGGAMAYALGCARPDLVRAIATVAMTLPETAAPACSAGRPIGFMLIHGTDDPLVPYYGGPIVVFGRSRDMVLSAEATAQTFQTRNHCRGRENARVTGSIQRIEATDCANPVVFVTLVGGGHNWPGVTPGLFRKFHRADDVEFSTPDEVLAFFRQF